MDGTRQLKEATMEDAALNLARGVIDREEALAPEGPSDPS
jgi:hypothetical protein